MELGVGINVFGQILLLGKVAAAYLAFELLQAQMNCQEVSF